jgi:hypothetical protein
LKINFANQRDDQAAQTVARKEHINLLSKTLKILKVLLISVLAGRAG